VSSISHGPSARGMNAGLCSSVCPLWCNSNDAHRKARNLLRVERGRRIADENHPPQRLNPSNNPTGSVRAPRFLHQLRGEKAQQGQRNQAPPAERAAGLDRGA
jgi:hypothetical protein